MGRRADVGRAAGVLIALLAALVAYYWVHKPVSAGLLLALGGAALDLTTAGAVVAAAGGVGRRVLARLDLAPLGRAERVALSAAVGLGLIALGALILGLMGLFRTAALWPALILAALWARRETGAWLRDVRALARSAWPADGWPRFLAALALILLALALLNALAPPHAWDAMTYHLAGPALDLAAKRITAHPENPFLGFPQQVEMLYGVAMSPFGRDTAAAPLHFAFGILALLSAAGLARRAAGDSAGRLAAVLLLSSFTTWLLFGRPYVDLAVMAYGAVLLSALSAWRQTRCTGWLAVIGALAGLAVGVKYTAGALLIGALAFVATVPGQGGDRRTAERVGAAALVLAFAALAYAPWAIRGAVLYGNPAYPFVFGGLAWDAARGAAFSGAGTGLLGSPDAWQLAVLPLAATVFGVERGAGFAFTTGPWLLTLPLLAAITRSRLGSESRRLLGDAARFGLPLLACWIVLAAFSGIGAQTRLAAGLLPVAAVAGALAFAGLEKLPVRPVNVAFVARGLLAATLLLGAAEPLIETAQVGAARYLLGQTPREDFLAVNLGVYRGALARLADLPPGSRVRLMWEPRSYGCPPALECLPDAMLDGWSYALRLDGSARAVFDRWYAEGDDALLLSDRGFAFMAQGEAARAEADAFSAELARRMEPVWTDDAVYTLYAWRDRE